MSTPPPFDIGNPLLAESPAVLTTSVVNGPGGQRLALTVRTPAATVTVFLAKGDADKWADNIRNEAAKMSGLIVPV